MLKIYGASDDCIEVDGEISEEWNDDSGVLAFSDGTLLSIRYNEHGIWQVFRLASGTAEYSHVQPDPDDEDNYSEVAILRSETPFSWVVFAAAREDEASVYAKGK